MIHFPLFCCYSLSDLYLLISSLAMPIAHLLVFRKKYCGAKLLVREAYSVVLPWLWASFCRPIFSKSKNVKSCLTGMQVPTVVTFLYLKKQTNNKKNTLFKTYSTRHVSAYYKCQTGRISICQCFMITVNF